MSGNSWGAHDTVTKIERFDGCLIGVSGNASVAFRLREWFKTGESPDKWPADANKDDDASLIVIRPSGIVQQFNTGPYPMTLEQTFCAWGAGRDFAVAAMHCGKSAQEAVELACCLSVHCGNGVDVLKLS